MTDYSELKRLAEACSAYWSEEYPDRTDYPDNYIDITEWGDAPEFEFYQAAKPAAVLALIAENERLRDHQQQLVDLREADGFDSWAAVLVKIDQLKAEVESLRSVLSTIRNHTSVSENQIAMIDAAMTKEQD